MFENIMSMDELVCIVNSLEGEFIIQVEFQIVPDHKKTMEEYAKNELK